MFVPMQAYVPPGPLHEAVAYPHAVDKFDATQIAAAIDAVGLGHLTAQAAGVERWDHWLTDDEKQRLAFARVILQRPRWIIVNDALEVLEAEWRKKIIAILAGFGDVGVINFGPDRDEPSFFARTLRLLVDPHGPKLSSAPQKPDEPGDSKAGSEPFSPI